MTLRELISESRRLKRQQKIISALTQLHNPATVRQLSNLLGLSNSLINRYLKECEEDNFIYRRIQNKGAHGRYYLVYLKGRIK